MFTLATPVKFVGLALLFVFCTAWCVYELTRRQDARQRVSNVLHLVMSVVMLAMVWTGIWMPLASVVGMPVFVATFAAATAWFVALAGRALRQARQASDASGVGRRDRALVWHYAGHAMMFAAMTWHLSAMSVKRGAMTSMGASSGASSGGMAGMPGMGGSTGASGMGGSGAGSMSDWTAQASQPGGVLWVFALVGVPFMAYLLIAGLNDVRRALLPRVAASDCACGADCACGPECACGTHVPASEEVAEHALAIAGTPRRGDTLVALAATCHEPRPVGTPAYRLSALADAAMNLGMFWMSTGLLVAIAPFMRVFSF